ncbi:MAG: hypothetical protein AB7C97_05825 [Oscillospiraceae bacterium]
MKKTVVALLVVILLIGLMPLSYAEGIAGSELHISYDSESVYGSDSYLYDTLTLAGSGMESVQSFTVKDLESLAEDESLNLGYWNTYSMLTSGSIFTAPSFSGIKLYDLLLYAGMDKDLPDSTPVKAVSKDGYTISFTLGQIRSEEYSFFSGKEMADAEVNGLPVIIAFGTNGYPLVGPTGTEPVTKRFEAADGYIETADNVGGSMRLIVGQTAADEFNAPNCAKWLAAVVVGDAAGYVYSRQTVDIDGSAEPATGGDWTHKGAAMNYTVTIKGTEAKDTVLTLGQMESMTDCTARGYYAASAGKYAFEGIVLRQLIEKYLEDGVTVPSKITVVSVDGYKKQLDVADVINGIDSNYQPGKHKDVILAYAVDSAPLVAGKEDADYNGYNAYGPMRLIVENTISGWVKSVKEIIIGDDISSLTRGDFCAQLVEKYALTADFSDNFVDVTPENECYTAVGVLRALGIANGRDYMSFDPNAVITEWEYNALNSRVQNLNGETA